MMNSAILIALALTAPATSVDGAVSVSALDVPVSDVDALVDGLVEARIDAERDHLRRLGLWGASSVVGGAALYGLTVPGVASDGGGPDTVRGFALQSVGWGAINLAIVGIGTFAPAAPPPTTREAALAAEDDLGKILWVNVGLDAGYMMAGGTLAAVGAFGSDVNADFVSHGAGIVTQGAGLLLLDLIAVWSSGPREEALQALPPTTTPPTLATTNATTLETPTKR